MFSFGLSFLNLIKKKKKNSIYLQMKMTLVQLLMAQRNVHVQQAIQAFHARVGFNTIKIMSDLHEFFLYHIGGVMIGI